MPLISAMAAAGIFEPGDLALLRNVFAKMARPDDSDLDREARAAALVQLYQSGVTSEGALLAAMGYDEMRDLTSADHSMSDTSPD